MEYPFQKTIGSASALFKDIIRLCEWCVGCNNLHDRFGTNLRKNNIEPLPKPIFHYGRITVQSRPWNIINHPTPKIGKAKILNIILACWFLGKTTDTNTKEIKVLGLPVAAEAADAGHWSHIHYQRVAMPSCLVLHVRCKLLQKGKACARHTECW